MPRWITLLLATIIGLSAVLSAQSCTPQEGGTHPLRIVVTLPPLAGLIRALAPPGSEVRVLLKPGRSEHGFELTSSDLNAVSKADILVYVGLGLESKIENFLKRHPSEDRVDVSFAKAVGIEGESHEGHDHAHDHDHEHGPDCDHGPVDPHLWLDPLLVEKLIPTLQQAVATASNRRGNPSVQEQQRLVAAAQQLTENVRAVNQEATEKLAPLAGQSVVTHHNAWGRLFDRYGLQVAAVIRPIETSEPTPAAVAAAVDAIRRQGVKAIFVEPQFSPTAAQRIAQATGVQIATLDPLGDGDWFAMMRTNIETLVNVLGTPR